MPGKHKNKHKGKQGTGDDALPTSPATPTPAENERALKKSQEIKQYLDRQIGDGDMIQYSPVYAAASQTRMDPIKGPVHSAFVNKSTDAKIMEDLNMQANIIDVREQQAAFVPSAISTCFRARALNYYTNNPIKDHTQSLPPMETTLISLTGESLSTSAKEVADTEDILVQDLLWPKRHVGRSILCRVLTRCRVHGGISFLVEDIQSQVISVTVKHPFPFPAIVYSPSEVQTLWPIGTCLYIKEPYVRMGVRGSQEILVAWPKDMVEVPRVAGIFDHPAVLPGSNNLALYRLAAAVAFAQNKVKLAIRLASIGLNLASLPHIHDKTDENDSHHLALLVGRALVYWLNDRSGAAYTDCLKAENMLETSSSDMIVPLSRRTALIRLQAAYKLRMFTVPSRHLVECEQVGVHSSISQLYRQAVKLRNEEKNGRFSSVRSPALLGSDRALYMGPIKVVIDPIKGRTVVTTRPVTSGELLLAEKPTIELKHNGSPGVSSWKACWGQVGLNPSAHNVSWTVHQIMDDPNIGQCVHSLAPTANVKDGNLGITDEERLAVFRNPCEIELDLLEQQINRNCFGEKGVFKLHGLGSMISHSCKTNLAETVSRDTTSYQRAVNDMAEGEELVTNYISPRRSFESRHTALLRNWSFDCDCALCKADKRPGEQHQLRAKIMSDEWPALEAEAQIHTRDIASVKGLPSVKVKSIITRLVHFSSRIDATYAPGRSAKLYLSQVQFALADLWASYNASDALRYYTTGFENIEWVFNTVEEMRTSKRAIRRYGFVDLTDTIIMANRLEAMGTLYRLQKLNHAASAMADSITAFAGLRISPVDTAPAASPMPVELDYDFVNSMIDSAIDKAADTKPGEAPPGPFSLEQLQKMYKAVTLPSGEQAMMVDFTGTILEGQEEEHMRYMTQFAKVMEKRKAGLK